MGLPELIQEGMRDRSRVIHVDGVVDAGPLPDLVGLVPLQLVTVHVHGGLLSLVPTRNT